MEDGIEMYRTTLYDDNAVNFGENTKNKISQTNTEPNEKKYIYIYVPKYGELEDCIITNNLNEAKQLLTRHSGVIKVFYKDNITNTYVPTINY